MMGLIFLFYVATDLSSFFLACGPKRTNITFFFVLLSLLARDWKAISSTQSCFEPKAWNHCLPDL